MTTPARQQQQEYIISGFALNEVVAHLKAAKMYDTAELMLVETRPHTSAPAPAQGTSKLCFGTQHPASECCQQCNELETCKQKQRYLDYDKAEAAKAAREQAFKKIYDMSECVPLKEYASDYDRGFHQAMTLVRGWCESLRQPEPQQ